MTRSLIRLRELERADEGGIRNDSLLVMMCVMLLSLAQVCLACDAGAALQNLIYTIGNGVKWTRLHDDDSKSRDAIMEDLDKISKYGSQSIRDALSATLKKRRMENKDYSEDLGEIFIMNRYIFDVPAKCPLSTYKAFGGWQGIPRNASQIDMLWPLSKNGKGKLMLTGSFRGYKGDYYDALGEFDYFLQHFQRRSHSDV